MTETFNRSRSGLAAKVDDLDRRIIGTLEEAEVTPQKNA